MREYELTIVLGEKTTAAKKKAVAEKVKKAVESLKGKVTKTEDWGKKELAYKLQGSGSGNFLFFLLELNPEGAKGIDSRLKMEEEIIRYLIVRK